MERYDYTNKLILDVQFITTEQVNKFVTQAEKCKGVVDVLSKDNYRVSGRSIIGIFSLDLTKPVTVVCDESNFREIYEVCKELNIVIE